MEGDFQVWVIKDSVASISLSLRWLTLGQGTLMSWGHSRSPVENPTWWEPESPANSSWVKPSDDRSLGQHLDSNLKCDPEPRSPNEGTPEFLTHRNYEIINICCFKPRSLGVICYAEIDHYCPAQMKKGTSPPCLYIFACGILHPHTHALFIILLLDKEFVDFHN